MQSRINAPFWEDCKSLLSTPSITTLELVSLRQKGLSFLTEPSLGSNKKKGMLKLRVARQIFLIRKAMMPRITHFLQQRKRRT